MERDKILHVDRHRRNANYSRWEQLRRLSWTLAKLTFRLSPRLCYGYRAALLRLFGAKIGRSVRIYPTVDVFFPWNIDIGDEVTIGDGVKLYSLGKISIGAGTMISFGAHFCAGTHDYHTANLKLLKPPIQLGEAIWVCAEAFIGPGVVIGDGCIVGARAAVFKSFPAMKIIGGNPAKILAERPVPSRIDPQFLAEVNRD